ncbi:MAG TPA: hypothetical protein VGN97_01060 [Mesorhizobium sp.]|jgi:Fe2+ or Zn2+ uptake regulation protein|nr:hypothetical protein [Mesorhizobium sp.]
MDLSANLKWLFEQPAAFWLTGIAIAIVSQIVWLIATAGYHRTSTRLRAGIIKAVLRDVSSLIPYAAKGELSYAQSQINLIITLYSNLNILAIVGSIVVLNAGGDEYIQRNIATALLAFSGVVFSIMARRVSLARTAIKFFHKFKIEESLSLTRESVVRFVAERAGASETQVNEVLASDPRSSAVVLLPFEGLANQ